ncbi:hypothetical protein ACTXT7_009674 [Hymenolepis weldensis]
MYNSLDLKGQILRLRKEHKDRKKDSDLERERWNKEQRHLGNLIRMAEKTTHSECLRPIVDERDIEQRKGDREKPIPLWSIGTQRESIMLQDAGGPATTILIDFDLPKFKNNIHPDAIIKINKLAAILKSEKIMIDPSKCDNSGQSSGASDYMACRILDNEPELQEFSRQIRAKAVGILQRSQIIENEQRRKKKELRRICATVYSDVIAEDDILYFPMSKKKQESQQFAYN